MSTDDHNIYYCKRRISACALFIVTSMVLFVLIVPTYLLFHLASKAEGGLLTARATATCIGVLLLFTLFFSTVLSLFTAAKRHEILAAAAA
jgi:hypothetical protein